MKNGTSASCARLAVLLLAALSASGGLAHDTNLGGLEAQGRYAVVHPIEDALPNHRLTPGVADPRITQANIGRTICVRGYTKTVRPPAGYTSALKREGIREYQYSDRRLTDYEGDLVGLELGGDPTDPRNIWPQPRHVIGGWGADAKDELENKLHHLVCRGILPLAEAQRLIVSDWIAAYKIYVGASPSEVSQRRVGHR